MEKGTIVRVIAGRGFGFIRTSANGDQTAPDLFFHCSALIGLTFDERLEQLDVNYDLETGRDGRQRAVNVRAR